MTQNHPAGGLKVFSTLPRNQKALSLCSPVTLPWAQCHKLSSPSMMQVLFLTTKMWSVAHSSKSNQLWIWVYTVADNYFRAHTSWVLFYTFFFSPPEPVYYPTRTVAGLLFSSYWINSSQSAALQREIKRGRKKMAGTHAFLPTDCLFNNELHEKRETTCSDYRPLLS